jgi:signal transduction histidine kinase/ActR/RegA family two-component response regulator
MLLFNLLLFLALRDIAYLLYVAFVSCMVLTIATQNGLAKEFLWNSAPAWSNIAANTGYSLSLAALLMFMRHMLHTDKVVAQSDRFIRPLIGVYLAMPIAFAVSLPTFIKPAALMYAATGVLILGLGVWCAFKRQRSAYFFVAAFGVLCIAAVASVLRAMGWLPTNAFTVNALQFGSGVEMLLLAFALADRFNAMRLEKDLAQQESLQLKSSALAQAMASLETVERIARHDLKTPLGALASAPALLRAGRTLAPQEETILRMMENAAQRALNLVNLTLDLHRMESGSYIAHPCPVDLSAVARSVAQDLGRQAQFKSVTLEVDDEDTTINAHAEEALCYSIIANLTKNAMEAAPPHTTVRMELHNHVHQGSPVVRLCIHNQGSVPLELRAEFFTKYSTAGKLGGNGLGTYSSHLLTQVQGGTLTMETSDDQGTTLTLQLPRSHARLQIRAPGIPATRTVLVVDDDEFNRFLLLAQLPQPPLEVRAAVNGQDALDAVKRTRPDAIILDIDMPVMDGLQALQHIRAYQASVGQPPSRIIAYTGNDQPHQYAEFLAQGFDHCLRKPSTQAALLALLLPTPPLRASE